MGSPATFVSFPTLLDSFRYTKGTCSLHKSRKARINKKLPKYYYLLETITAKLWWLFFLAFTYLHVCVTLGEYQFYKNVHGNTYVFFNTGEIDLWHLLCVS